MLPFGLYMVVNKNCPAKCSNKHKELADKCVTNRNNEDSINFGQPPPPTSLLLFAHVICDQNLNHLAGSYSSLFISSPQITNKNWNDPKKCRKYIEISLLWCWYYCNSFTKERKKSIRYSSVSCGSSLSLFKCACKW